MDDGSSEEQDLNLLNEEGNKDDSKGEPQTVPIEDFKNLQSTYDKKLADQGKQISDLNNQVGQLQADLKLAKEGIPADVEEKLKAEKDLRTRQEKLAQEQAAVDKRALDVKARELLTQYPKTEMTVEELVKLGNSTDMELAVLRKVTELKPKPELPSTETLDKGGHGAGAPTTERARDLAAVTKAMGRK